MQEIKKTIIIAAVLLSPLLIFGQNIYPYPVKKTDTLRLLTKRGFYNFKAKNDTLWILKNTQYQNALIKAKRLELSEIEIVELKNQINLYKDINTEQDSLVSVIKKDRAFYEKNLKECSNRFEIMAARARRQSLYKKLALVGIPVAFAVGFFLK